MVMISQIYEHWPYLHQVQNLRIWLKDMYPFMQLDVNLDSPESITLGPVGVLADFQGLGHLLRTTHHLRSLLSPTYSAPVRADWRGLRTDSARTPRTPHGLRVNWQAAKMAEIPL